MELNGRNKRKTCKERYLTFRSGSNMGFKRIRNQGLTCEGNEELYKDRYRFHGNHR